MKIDINKSLADQSEFDWGEAPINASQGSKERYIFRRTKLIDLSLEGLERLIEINFENDNQILIPFALHTLNKSADDRNFNKLEVLQKVLKQDDYQWTNHSEQIENLREICNEWLYALYQDLNEAEQTDDSNEFYKDGFKLLQLENRLLKEMLNLEKRL